MKPARPVVTRAPHRSVGLITPSGLDCPQVAHESFLEKNFIALALMCSATKQLYHQPFRLELVDTDGVSRRYVPDFLDKYTDGPGAVVEVKPKTFVQKSELLFNAAAVHLRNNGYHFYVITEEHVSDARFDVVQLWRRYRRYTPLQSHVSDALALVNDGVSWAEALSSGIPLVTWYNLLGRGVLRAENPDLLPKSPTRLYRSERETEHDCNVRFMRWFGCSPWTTNL